MKISDITPYRSEDKYFDKNTKSTRLPDLTLRHLNKLGKLRELRNLELAHEGSQLEKIYGGDTEESGGEEPF